ncbi:MAG: hypothetical protein LCH84_11010 [Gemmatimonadetes bacterium]|nr:hypothetical protein [Gemmatimonadota bacterium]
MTRLSGRVRGAMRLVLVGAAVLWGCQLPGRRARPGTTAAVVRPETTVTPPAAVPPGAPPAAAQRPDSSAPPPFRADSVSDSVRADSGRGAKPVRPAPAKKPAPSTRNCVLDFAESPPETRLTYNRLSETVSNTFIGGGFIGRCQGERNRLRADSAEQFQAAGVVNLYGNVVYEEPGKMQVTAMHAVYFTREGRLYADGNVVATQLATGSTFSGPSLEYYRAMPDRPVSRMIAPARSVARLIEKDSTGKLSPPTTVMANRFEDAGDSILVAFGDVVITRESITGRSDSAAFDKPTEKARLVRNARIVNDDTTRRFTLTGDTIDLFSKDRQLERVVARHRGKATSDDLELDAEQIDLRLSARVIEEAFAWGAGRARARTPQQDVEADSLRIRLVDKRVREVHAIGGARTAGVPDTMKIRTPDRDLLRGDSIFAWFDSSEALMRDTAARPRMKEVLAVGNASSLFHMANARGREAPPAINYVRGRRISVAFDTGAVRTVRVDSAASGVYLEPNATDSLADSLRDTSRARPKPPGTRPPGSRPPANRSRAPRPAPFVPAESRQMPWPTPRFR